MVRLLSVASNLFLAASASSILSSSSSTGSTNGIERRAITNANTPPVSVKGNAFFAGGKRFYIRGVDYQPGGSSAAEDPIADPVVCKRDIVKFKQLGINTVRIYTVDNSKNHDECMKALADAGIYLALDVNTPTYSLNRYSPDAIRISYNEVYLQSVFATVEMFAQYDNTLLFFSANEVINDNTTTFAAPYIKALTRDIKSYISARKLRSVPVGYSAADIDSNRYQTATYMNCGADSARSDFFAFNDYSWCDPSSFTQSGWDKKVQQYKDYSLPIFLSEFGCNTNKREFKEVASLYSTQMTSVYSGGLVYEYSQEPSNYGLVDVKSDGTVSDLPDFATLQSAYKNTANPSGDGGYKSNGSPSTCPSASTDWEVRTNDLPSMPSKAQTYLQNGAGKGPGNSNKEGSQTAGTPSTGVSGSTGSNSSSSTTSSAAAGASTTRASAASGSVAGLAGQSVFGALVLVVAGVVGLGL